MLNNDLCCVFSNVFAHLHCKILFPYRFANFSDIFHRRIIFASSNYLCDRSFPLSHNSHFHSWFSAVRPIHAYISITVRIQYSDNLCWIMCKGAFQPHQPVTDYRIRKLWHVYVENFFSPERAYLPSVATFQDFSSQTCYDYCCIIHKILQNS